MKVTLIEHATMVLEMSGQVIYVDPVGGAEKFQNLPNPEIILITDIHSDHLSPDTLREISQDMTTIIVPQAVKNQLPDDIPGNLVVLNNGDKATQKGVEIEAIPMYNLPESSDTFHTKGRGNGYVVSDGMERIYIAGDISAVPEMRNLDNIDIAFIPMNLPYTMDVEEAAEGVLDFKPKKVHPYHYRGQDGLSDVQKFKQLIEEGDSGIEVKLLEFYP